MNTGTWYPQQDDKILWDRLREGDREAFGEIYRRYFPPLFRYCSRFTQDAGLVKDTLQDFFTDLYLRREALQTPDKPKSYLLVSVRRKLVRILGKTPRPHALTDMEAPAFFLELSPESYLISRQNAAMAERHVQQTIGRLTLRQKEAVYLRFYESLSYEEIAEVMQLKAVKYARTLVYRALTELKPLLAGAETLLYSR
ncbi:RNA polymerase sigma factor [Chitinophaga rhizosphaerae]|uniref:RNA polymerase sigma factor n=1 Tax=Chitinophaga rhizosphaerae TaxID=1864947 RepID=UPI000F7FBE83|nr:RNA polymerase sigma factor [Chitinophaga rhizosphaerae]